MTTAVAGAVMLPPTKAAATTGTTTTGTTELHAPTDRGRRGLTYRGIVYEVGEGETPAAAWSARRMRAAMRAIRHDLHADSVKVTGDGVERLTATAGVGRVTPLAAGTAVAARASTSG